MAQHTADDGTDAPKADEETEDAEAVTVELLWKADAWKRGVDVDPESEAYKIACDAGTFGSGVFDSLDMPAEDIIEVGYASLGTTEVDADRVTNISEFLESVWTLCQGGRTPETVPYDGAELRSMSKGDIVAVNGVYYAVDGFGFSEVHYEAEGDGHSDAGTDATDA